MFYSVSFILLLPVPFPDVIPDPEDSDMGCPHAPGGPVVLTLAAGGPPDCLAP